MKRYCIPVEKTEYGWIPVYAESLDDAIDFCKRNSGEYIPETKGLPKTDWKPLSFTAKTTNKDLVDFLKENKLSDGEEVNLTSADYSRAYRLYGYDCRRRKIEPLPLEEFVKTKDFLDKINDKVFESYRCAEVMEIFKRENPHLF